MLGDFILALKLLKKALNLKMGLNAYR